MVNMPTRLTPKHHSQQRAVAHSSLFKYPAIMAASAMSLLSLPTQAIEFFDGKVKANAYLMQGYQSLEADAGAYNSVNEQTSAGYDRLRFNLELTFHLSENIYGFVDLAEEPNDFGGSNQVSQDYGYIDFNVLGLMDIKDSKDELHLRAGNIESSTFEFRGFSDGAAVQANPLIGNSIIDFVTAESGAQVIWTRHLDQGSIDSVSVNYALTVPTFNEDYGEDRGFNMYGDFSMSTDFGLDLGLAWFTSDLGGQVGKRDFSDIQVAGMIYGDGDNYNFPGSPINSRDTHAGLLPGLDLTIWQINARYKLSDDTLFRAWFGVAKDDFSFIDADGNRTVASVASDYSAQESEMSYFALEATQYLVPNKFYIAARYSSASNDSEGVSGEEMQTRTQVGAGWWIEENALLKAEYVSQVEEANSPGQIGSDWDGFSIEVSMRF